MVDALHRDSEGREHGPIRDPAGEHGVKINHDDRGRVTGVVYADKTGALHEQKARAVCVAGNSVETPRLLLNSESSKFPNAGRPREPARVLGVDLSEAASGPARWRQIQSGARRHHRHLGAASVLMILKC